MGAMDEILAGDAFAFLDEDSFFGEPAVFTPKIGAPLRLSVLVERDQPMPAPGTNEVLAPVIRVSLPKPLIRSIDTGGDVITIPRREGGPPEDFQIKQILRQDAGMWYVRVS